MDLGQVYGGCDYDAFGCLFGIKIRNHAGFRPLAAGRGLPPETPDAVPAGGEWAPVWAVMKALADAHGPENVRLVVWFDN
ncbi:MULTISPECIES: hypothetical protein [Streptomyces]|uniref:hypothetical protein n=1 Tax=Streptomyces TaxID=1883 RepID=UPI00278C1595|nr:hypothetical protein [Streptomyces hydrogenans]